MFFELLKYTDGDRLPVGKLLKVQKFVKQQQSFP